MKPTPLETGTWSVLREGRPANDTPQMMRVFEVFLNEARWRMARAWLEEGEGTEAPDSFSQHRALLAALAARPAGILPPNPALPTPESRPIEVRPGLAPAPVGEPVSRKPEPRAEAASVDGMEDLVRQSARRHRVPEGLFLKLIHLESSLDPRALSPKGAMGLGQLMPQTARELGLTLDPKGGAGSVWHPQSNLDAAARYLRGLHDEFLNRGIPREEAWTFAGAAYNAGIGNISRALDRLQADGAVNWDSVARQLPAVTGTASRETLRYVARLRA